MEKHWEGDVTFTKKDNKREFALLRWLAQAASRDKTRYFMAGIFNELVDGNRVFVATDGRRLHKVEVREHKELFDGVPVGKNLSFKADAKQITFTKEIDGDFPNYKKIIPESMDVDHVSFTVHKTKELEYTEALYALYSKGIKVNAPYIEDMGLLGSDTWQAYRFFHRGGHILVCTRRMAGAVCQGTFSLLPE